MTVPEAPKKHTNNVEAHLPISIFAYGTLKAGFANHDRFCRNAIDIRPAATWGHLYDLGPYPALEIPESHILAYGTADPLADAQTQARLNATTHTFSRPIGDWDLIQGELITFPNPARDLPPNDQLEGFRVGGPCLYHRVIVGVWQDAKHCLAWVYSMNCRLNGIGRVHWTRGTSL